MNDWDKIYLDFNCISEYYFNIFLDKRGKVMDVKINLSKPVQILLLILVSIFAGVMIANYIYVYKKVESGDGAYLYGEDKRVANYTGITVDMQPVNYVFTSHNGASTFNTVRYYDKNVYNYYKGLDRYYAAEDYNKYVEDEYNLEAVRQVVSIVKECKLQAGYSEHDTMMEAINFVQKNIEYKSDMETRGVEEYPRYPIETLLDGCGDCEDTSVLLAAIMKEMNYGVILLAYDDHMAVGIEGGEGQYGTFYEYDGKKYFYVETTDFGWTVGDVPAEYRSKRAQVISIN